MTTDRSPQSDRYENQDSSKLPYSTPVLVIHGQMQDITGSGGETPADVGKGTS
jgi:hypothetical protein